MHVHMWQQCVTLHQRIQAPPQHTTHRVQVVKLLLLLLLQVPLLLVMLSMQAVETVVPLLLHRFK